VEKTYALGFDVYGTLVDPLALAEPLQALVGEHAVQFANLWRTKQLEYSFRRGLMRRYVDFDICTRQAKSRNWNELGLEMKDKVLRFEVLAEDEWEAKLNEVLTASD